MAKEKKIIKAWAIVSKKGKLIKRNIEIDGWKTKIHYVAPTKNVMVLCDKIGQKYIKVEIKLLN